MYFEMRFLCFSFLISEKILTDFFAPVFRDVY